MNKLFESQWKATKAALCEGRDLTHNMDGTPNANKKMMETVLENTRKELSRLNEAQLPVPPTAPTLRPSTRSSCRSSVVLCRP
jgi:hypothetical protein